MSINHPIRSILYYCFLFVGLAVALITQSTATAVVLSTFWLTNVIIDATERLIATRNAVVYKTAVGSKR